MGSGTFGITGFLRGTPRGLIFPPMGGGGGAGIPESIIIPMLIIGVHDSMPSLPNGTGGGGGMNGPSMRGGGGGGGGGGEEGVDGGGDSGSEGTTSIVWCLFRLSTCSRTPISLFSRALFSSCHKGGEGGEGRERPGRGGERDSQLLNWGWLVNSQVTAALVP